MEALSLGGGATARNCSNVGLDGWMMAVPLSWSSDRRSFEASLPQDTIDIAPDRETATAFLHCMVHAETPIGPGCPLVGMARQQGGGVVRRTERGVFENVYVRRDGAWTIERAAYRCP